MPLVPWLAVVPAGHIEQRVDPAGANHMCSLRQGIQADPLLTVPYDPVGQGAHTLDPEAENFPGAHAMQYGIFEYVDNSSPSAHLHPPMPVPPLLEDCSGHCLHPPVKALLHVLLGQATHIGSAPALAL